MSLLPGPLTRVHYIQRYVISEDVVTGLYCVLVLYQLLVVSDCR